MASAHLLSNKFNVAQVLTAAQTELLELFGDPAVKKVSGRVFYTVLCGGR